MREKLRLAVAAAVALVMLVVPATSSVALGATTCQTKSATFKYADRFEWYNGFGSTVYYDYIKVTGSFCWNGTTVWAQSGTTAKYANVSGPFINATQPAYYSTSTGYVMARVNYGVYAVRGGLGPVYLRVYPRLRVGINGNTYAFDNNAGIYNNAGQSYSEYQPVFVSATIN